MAVALNYYCPGQRDCVLLLLPSLHCVIQKNRPSRQVSLRLILLEFRRWEDLRREVLESGVKFRDKRTGSLTELDLRALGD